MQQLLDEKALDVRDAAQFDAANDWVRQELNSTAEQIALKVEQILTLYQGIKKRTKGKNQLRYRFCDEWYSKPIGPISF